MPRCPDTKKTFQTVVTSKGRAVHLLTLPGTKLFEFEIVNKYGSHIERIYQQRVNRDVFGIAHLVEHLSFLETMDYDTRTLMDALKNYGQYNATTDYESINYWLHTIMDHAETAIRLVCNVAFNDLSRISKQQFEVERDVVYNEIKGDEDDASVMFVEKGIAALCGYHEHDTVGGASSNIRRLRLQDAIAVKEILIQNADVVYNITYDPVAMSRAHLLKLLDDQLDRFEFDFRTFGASPISRREYAAACIPPSVRNGKRIRVNNAFRNTDLSFTMVVLDVITTEKEIVTADYANLYIERMATKVSLTDVIRNYHGLTYGLWFFTKVLAGKTFTIFSCDVSKGDERLMMRLFRESINLIADEWSKSTAAHKKFMANHRILRTQMLADPTNYGVVHGFATWNPAIVRQHAALFAKDVDAAYAAIERRYASHKAINDYIQRVRDCVNRRAYTKIVNY